MSRIHRMALALSLALPGLSMAQGGGMGTSGQSGSGDRETTGSGTTGTTGQTGTRRDTGTTSRPATSGETGTRRGTGTTTQPGQTGAEDRTYRDAPREPGSVGQTPERKPRRWWQFWRWGEGRRQGAQDSGRGAR